MSAEDFFGLGLTDHLIEVSELVSEVCIPTKDGGNLVPL